MTIRIKEDVVQHIGEVYENGWWGGNGVVEVGESVKGADGYKHKISTDDLRSFESFDRFLEMISGGKVDFVGVAGNQFRFMVYRKERRDSDLLVVSDGAGVDRADAAPVVQPDTFRYGLARMDKQMACYETDDLFYCLDRLQYHYDRLMESAEAYVAAQPGFREATRRFWQQRQYTAQDVQRYAEGVKQYNRVYDNWRETESAFYYFRPQPARRLPEPEPEWAPPLPPPPPPPGRPGRLPPPPPPPDRGGGNNPDKDDDF